MRGVMRCTRPAAEAAAGLAMPRLAVPLSPAVALQLEQGEPVRRRPEPRVGAPPLMLGRHALRAREAVRGPLSYLVPQPAQPGARRARAHHLAQHRVYCGHVDPTPPIAAGRAVAMEGVDVAAAAPGQVELLEHA